MKSIPMLLVVMILSLLQLDASAQSKPFARSMSVTSSSVPEPVLKYRFYRPMHDLKGNSPDDSFRKITELYKSLTDEDRVLIAEYRKKSFESPSSGEGELLADKRFDIFLEPIHELAICSFPERQKSYDVKPEAYWEQPLPELTAARGIASLLKCKIETSSSIDDRVQRIAHGIRLAKYVGEGATAVCKLTSAAMLGLMLESIEGGTWRHSKGGTWGHSIMLTQQNFDGGDGFTRLSSSL